jgi:hypothetical protein
MHRDFPLLLARLFLTGRGELHQVQNYYLLPRALTFLELKVCLSLNKLIGCADKAILRFFSVSTDAATSAR